MTGRSPKGSGSRPSGRASKAVSPVPASIPSAAFTPGPWEALLTDSETHAVVSPATDAPLPWFTAIIQCADERVEHANARLIAAAPELYEALADFIASADRGYVSVETDRAARAALEKARGGQQ